MTFVLDYAKVSPITVVDVISRQFNDRVIVRWVDFNSDTFGIRIVNLDNVLTADEIAWIENYLAPFRFEEIF